MYVHVCVHACVRACVRVCVRACVRVYAVCIFVFVWCRGDNHSICCVPCLYVCEVYFFTWAAKHVILVNGCSHVNCLYTAKCSQSTRCS